MTTVFNVAFSSRYGWTGARGTLAAQIHELAPNPVVMGTTWEAVAAAVARDASYAAEFRAAFPEGATPANVRSALLEFTRSLVTPNAPFDRYLRGEQAALSPAARDGYRLFRTLGCVSCHQGANVGGNMFQTFGVMGDYFADRGTPLTDADQGRFAVTGRESAATSSACRALPQRDAHGPLFPRRRDGDAASRRAGDGPLPAGP